MSGKRIALIFVFVLLFFTACGRSNGAERLSEGLSGDYTCKLNIKSTAGELLFGGTLFKADGEYVFVLEHPSKIAGARYIRRDKSTVLQIGDMSIPLGGLDAKISKVFDALSRDVAYEKCEKVRLYGEDAMKISLADGELYFLNNKPLLLTFEDVRVEITGFTYGKDDNFGYKDQKSVA